MYFSNQFTLMWINMQLCLYIINNYTIANMKKIINWLRNQFTLPQLKLNHFLRVGAITFQMVRLLIWGKFRLKSQKFQWSQYTTVQLGMCKQYMYTTRQTFPLRSACTEAHTPFCFILTSPASKSSSDSSCGTHCTGPSELHEVDANQAQYLWKWEEFS